MVPLAATVEHRVWADHAPHVNCAIGDLVPSLVVVLKPGGPPHIAPLVPMEVAAE